MRIRLFSFLLLLSTLAIGSDEQQIRELYEQQSYQQCIDAAFESSAYGNATIQWYWGLSAEAVGDDDAAVSAYERVLLLEPDNTDAAIRLAQLFAKMQMDASADEVLATLQGHTLSPKQRTTLDALKDKDGRLSDAALRAKVRIGYDDNVNFGTGSDRSVQNQYGTTVNGTDPLSSTFFEFQGDLTLSDDLEKRGGWYVRSDVNLYARENLHQHHYDTYYGKVYAGMGYRFGGITLYLPLFYDRMYYLQKDFLHEHGARPDIHWLLSPELIVSAYMNVYQKRYRQELYRAADTNILGGGMEFTWLQDQGYAYLRTALDDHDPAAAVPFIYTEKKVWNSTIGGQYSLNGMADIKGSYSYCEERYEDLLFATQQQRKDKKHTVVIGIEKVFLKHYVLDLEYRYAANHTEYAIAEYDKQSVTLGVEYNY